MAEEGDWGQGLLLLPLVLVYQTLPASVALPPLALELSAGLAQALVLLVAWLLVLPVVWVLPLVSVVLPVAEGLGVWVPLALLAVWMAGVSPQFLATPLLPPLWLLSSPIHPNHLPSLSTRLTSCSHQNCHGYPAITPAITTLADHGYPAITPGMAIQPSHLTWNHSWHGHPATTTRLDMAVQPSQLP